MRKHFKLLFLGSLLFLLIGLIGCSNSNNNNNAKNEDEKEIIKIRIGSGHTVEGATWTNQTANFFIPEVNKRLEDTSYEVDWNESYGGSVAVLGEELEAVESNLLDMDMLVVPFMPSDLLVSNIGYNTPFGSPDPLVMAEVMTELFESHPEIAEEYVNKNQKFLSLGVSDSYQLVTSFPVEKIDDIKGKKIGGAGSNLEWLKAVGATPVQGGLAETYQNIQSGVYDGYIMYTTGAYGYKLHEVAPHMTKVDFGSILVGVLTINNDTFEKLPEEVQKVIEEVGKELTVKIAEYDIEKEKEFQEKMKEEGAEIHELSDEERQKWANMLPNQPNNYAEKMNQAGLPGTEIMQNYLELMEDKGYSFPREYEID